MPYYRVIETNPTDWETTENIINTFGGTHYATMMSNKGTYRKFVVNFADTESLVIAKLMLNNVSIELLSKEELYSLEESGHIGKAKESNQDTLRRFEEL